MGRHQVPGEKRRRRRQVTDHVTVFRLASITIDAAIHLLLSARCLTRFFLRCCSGARPSSVFGTTEHKCQGSDPPSAMFQPGQCLTISGISSMGTAVFARQSPIRDDKYLPPGLDSPVAEWQVWELSGCLPGQVLDESAPGRSVR